MKTDTSFLAEIIAAARIEYNHFKNTPHPMSWLEALAYGLDYARQERALAAIYAELDTQGTLL